jgi:hypothetical protein
MGKRVENNSAVSVSTTPVRRGLRVLNGNMGDALTEWRWGREEGV